MGWKPNGISTNIAGKKPTPAPETRTHVDEDPYTFLFELAYISPSQEEILNRIPYAVQYDDVTSPFSGIIPVDSAPIATVSPPEKVSLPSSECHRCAVNRAVDVDCGCGSHEFADFSDESETVDFERASELGLSTQDIDVAEGSRGKGGDRLSEIPHEFDDFESGVSDLGDSSVKKIETFGGCGS